MISTEKKYKLKELHIGMTVTKEELSEIYDTWIILIKHKNDKEYKIGFIGKETNEESARLYKNPDYVICPVYNDSLEVNGDIYYEE